jgi:hypothetical protein
MTPMRASGTIQVLLYHDMTEAVHGMMLSDGRQLRLPPKVTEELRRSLRVGQVVEVKSYGTENEYGRAMEALRLRIDHGRLIPISRSTWMERRWPSRAAE